MSVKIMGKVWDANLPREEKFVLLAYADHADHQGDNIYPSVELMAWKTGYSERSIQAVTRRLEKKGYLIPQGQSRLGTNKYTLDFKALPARPELEKKPTGRPKGGAEITPRKNNTLKKEAKGGAVAAAPDPSSDPSDHIYNGSHHETENPFSQQEENPAALALRTALCAVAKEKLALGIGDSSEEKYDETVRILLADGRQPKDIHAFGKWWEKNGHYQGRPSLKSIRDNLEDALTGVVNSSPSGTSGGTGSAAAAWEWVMRWVTGGRRGKIDDPAILEAVRRVGAERIGLMRQGGDPQLKKEFLAAYDFACKNPPQANNRAERAIADAVAGMKP